MRRQPPWTPETFLDRPYGDPDACWGCGLDAYRAGPDFHWYSHMPIPLCEFCGQLRDIYVYRGR